MTAKPPDLCTGRGGHWTGLAVALFVSGCAGAPLPKGATVAAHRGAESAVPAPLSAKMARLALRLVRVGMQETELGLDGFIPSGTRQSFPLDLPPRACLTLVAMATDGVSDMDAALYTPDGQLLAADSQPDSHPAIQVCGAEQARRFYYVLHSYDGSGSFLMRGFAGPRALLSQVGRELGGRPAVAVNPDSDQTIEDAIQGLSEGLQKRGYTAGGEPIRVELAASQRMRVGVPVKSGECYTVAALASDGLSVVNLRVLDDRGSEVVGDRAPTDHAQVQFCARAGAEYAAEAQAAAGAGAATLLVFHGSAHHVLGQAGLWQGQTEAAKLHPTLALSEALAKVERDAAQAGFARTPVRFEGYLQFGEVVEHGVELRGQRCFRLVATGDAGLTHLVLELFRPAEGNAAPAPASPVIDGAAEVCVTRSETIVARLTAEHGSGSYALTVFAR